MIGPLELARVLDETLDADVVLVVIGRKPNTDGLALDKAGLLPSARK